MSRPPPGTHIRPALSIQVAQLRSEDDASPGDASPGAGPLKRVSPRKGALRRVPYLSSTSPLAAPDGQTPGLSSKLADFSLLTPREDERPVSTRTRRQGTGAGFGTRKTSPLGTDACANDAVESVTIAQVERSLAAVSRPIAPPGHRAPPALSSGERQQVPPRVSSLRPLKRASAEPGVRRRVPTPRSSYLNPARQQPATAPAAFPPTLPLPPLVPRASTPPPPLPPPQDVPSANLRRSSLGSTALVATSSITTTLTTSSLAAAAAAATAATAAAYAAPAAPAPVAPARTARSSKRRSSATDPIVELGYIIKGPIAAGVGTNPNLTPTNPNPQPEPSPNPKPQPSP